MKSRVTIKDIAQKTGFSVTTISLVLNDKANHIPRETKLIIAKAVKEMGYRLYREWGCLLAVACSLVYTC